jgi:hypothetical protein
MQWYQQLNGSSFIISQVIADVDMNAISRNAHAAGVGTHGGAVGVRRVPI